MDDASRPRPPPLVLASASPTRLRLLRAAGLAVAVDPAAIDEGEVKRSLKAEGAPPERAAETLAEWKAQTVSRRHPGALVLGADQILACDGAWFDKPADRAAARAQLRALRGRSHELLSAALLVRDGARLWHAVGRARLAMRPFGDGFIEDYLAAVGDAALQSVGAYQVEGRGIQLFERIEGDWFTILGLPLLPLLAVLREHGLVPA